MSENKYSMKDVYKTVGEEGSLREAVDNFKESILPDDDEFIKWWYDSNNLGLGYKSPDELCKEGGKDKKYLEVALKDMFYGSHGG